MICRYLRTSSLPEKFVTDQSKRRRQYFRVYDQLVTIVCIALSNIYLFIERYLNRIFLLQTITCHSSTIIIIISKIFAKTPVTKSRLSREEVEI